MDFNKKGVIKISDMQKFYNAYKHPKVIKGGLRTRKGLILTNIFSLLSFHILLLTLVTIAGHDQVI